MPAWEPGSCSGGTKAAPLTARMVANRTGAFGPHQEPSAIAPGLAVIEQDVRLTDKIMI